jgi:hypothetical protein
LWDRRLLRGVTYIVRAKGNEQYDVFKDGQLDGSLSSTQLRNDRRFYRDNPKEFADFRRKLDQKGEAEITIEDRKSKARKKH